MLDPNADSHVELGTGSAQRSLQTPQPLHEVIDWIGRAVGDIAAGADGREAMHTVRSGLPDINALTEEDSKIRRVIDRVMSVGDRLPAPRT